MAENIMKSLYSLNKRVEIVKNTELLIDLEVFDNTIVRLYMTPNGEYTVSSDSTIYYNGTSKVRAFKFYLDTIKKYRNESINY